MLRVVFVGRRSFGSALREEIIEDLLNVGAYAELRQLGVGGIGIDTVGKEDIDEFVVGISPNIGACEASVAKAFGRNIGTCGSTLGLLFNGLVETQTAAIVIVGKLHTGEFFDGGSLEIALATVFAMIEEHLEQDRDIVCVGKQAGMAGNTAEHGGCRVVDVAMNQLFAEHSVELGGNDAVFGEELGRFVADVVETHGQIEILIDIRIEGGSA